jgi:hypothetical protein
MRAKLLIGAKRKICNKSSPVKREEKGARVTK